MKRASARLISGTVLSCAASALTISAASAGEITQLYRGARAEAMGNAFVGLADDEEALFYNPAGLAGNKGYTLHIVQAQGDMSAGILQTAADASKAFSNPGFSSINVLMGKNISARATATSIFQAQGFAIGMIADQQLALRPQNQALPNIEYGYMTTNGVQAGYGFSLNRGRQSKNDLRFGIGAKILNRRGNYQQIPLLTLYSLSKESVLDQTGNFERGYGVDLGTQFIHHVNKAFSLSAGAAYTDIGDIAFQDKAMPVKGNLTLGVAAVYEMRLAKAIMTYDYRGVRYQTDWRKKNHIGFELQLPIVSLELGLNQVYPTYGASVSLWLFKISGYTYTEELGSFVYQNPERRWGLKIGTKFNI